MNYWISWNHEKHFTPFEIDSPWWISGQGADGLSASICCAIKAENELDAIAKIYKSYDETPKNINFRFQQEKPNDWIPFSDRFPKADWMKWDNEVTEAKE